MGIRDLGTHRHSGILHASSEEVFLLHLAWHCDLRNEKQEKPEYGWVMLPVVAERAQSVADFCRMIGKKIEALKVPYAFKYSGSYFDAAGNLRLAPGDVGLTCSTFIVAVLSSIGIDLLRWQEWKQREGDESWQTLVVGRLEERGASAEHVAAIRADLNSCARIRPEDVAGACTSGTIPVSFTFADDAGKDILRRLKAAQSR